jgi:hypothetical protein
VDNFPSVSRFSSVGVPKFWAIFPVIQASAFPRRKPLATVQTSLHPTRTLKTRGTKIASLILQARVLLFSQNHFDNA